ncbi:MAG TPA: ABC transporter ATP-binding protein [Kaistiaceae bacterium]|nr:ABC transporter ATP-binding protein [Kaistiaceae bacterium]
MNAVLEVKDIGIDFGGVRAVDEVSFEIRPGQIFSIIGPNGAGKTTMFNLISGVYTPSRGAVKLAGEDVTGLPPHRLARLGLSRTFQNLQVYFRMTAVENVMVGRHIHEHVGITAQLFNLPSVRAQNRASRQKAMELLDFVGLADKADEPAGSLPYGALKRLEIARSLALGPKLLLLDEPAAGCNAVETEEIDGLIQEIAKSGVTVALVEHDMRLVMKISDRILVLDYGRKLIEGTATEVRNDPEVIAAYLGAHGQTEAARADH